MRRHVLASGETLDSVPCYIMRILLNVVAALCLLTGCVWFLQGINILPGSFMTGQTKWAVYGGILIVLGLGLLLFGNRRRV